MCGTLESARAGKQLWDTAPRGWVPGRSGSGNLPPETGSSLALHIACQTLTGLILNFSATWRPCFVLCWFCFFFSQVFAYARVRLPCVIPAQGSLLSADRCVYLYGIHYVRT